MTTRRDFLKTTATIGGVLLAGADTLRAQAAIDRMAAPKARAKMNVLVLGGTGFIGPHLVRHARARGHQVTIFTRGRRDAELPDDIIRLQGDRNGHLESLVGKQWDVVVDDSAVNPDWVKQSTALLKGNVGQYLFTSSTGVLYPYLKRGLDENGPAPLEAADPKDPSASYGVAKARCEREVMSAFGDRSVIVRPTYIVGPGDTSDRFPYWPQRLVKGGEVLAPGRRDDPAQFIDVRDLSEFMIKLLEDGKGGVYNAAGPKTPILFREFLSQAQAALNTKATFTWIDDYAFLSEHKIEESIPWAMLKGNDDGMMSIRNDKAVAAGLTFRPLATTVRDTLAWWQTVPEARRNAPKFEITPEKEAKALADWHALKG
ncbi:MAG: 2-hydroxyisoflavone reductase [Gemmatimonadetes bacterium]|nr:2-hydroxyisoflavone reductase [Gemmatimonadota bacterium]